MLIKAKWLAVGVMGLISATASATTINTGAGGLSQQDQVQAVTAVRDVPTTNWRSGTYGAVPNVKASAQNAIMPYGEQLFTGGFRGVRSDGLNPEYRIAPGDLITLRL